VLAQTLSYSAFLGATLLSTPAEKNLVGKFIAGLFIARIPILLFQAVQAALLPNLAAHAGAGRHDDFKAGLRRLIVIVSAVGALGIVAGFTIAPGVGKVLFGQKFILGSRDLGLLAVGTAAFILALTIAQGLIALRGYREAAIAWTVGIVMFVIATAIGNDLFLRVEIGSAVGSLAAALVMYLFVTLRMRSGVKPDVEALVEVIEHEPLEI
jgi:O-antigen/teichoic acid export membrane protein